MARTRVLATTHRRTYQFYNRKQSLDIHTDNSNTVRVNDDFDLLVRVCDTNIRDIANENMKMREKLTLSYDVCAPTPNTMDNKTKIIIQR